MSASEIELVRIVRGSKDPAKVQQAFRDMLRRMVAGEDWESICKDYGIDPEEVERRRGAPC